MRSLNLPPNRHNPESYDRCHLSLITGHCLLERETGIEPATNSLEGCDSTTELLPPTKCSDEWLVESDELTIPNNPTRRATHPPLVTGHWLYGGQGRIRTSVDRMGRQIYSLLLLTAQPPVRICSQRQDGACALPPATQRPFAWARGDLNRR